MKALTNLHRAALAGVALTAVALVASGCSSDTRSKRQATKATAAALSSAADMKTKPKIKKIKPNSGTLAGGEQLVIEGKRFLKDGAGTTRVLFGTTAVQVTPVSDEEIWVVTPPATTPGPVDVFVINDHGSDSLTAGFTYELDKKTKPKLKTVTPDRGPLAGGTPVVIEGKRFLEPGAGETIVLFGTERVVVSPTSDERLEVRSPAGLRPGKVQVRVLNDHGVDELLDAFDYEATGSEALAFAPAVGRFEDGVGTRVTLTSSFAVTTSATVTFDGLQAPVVAAVSSFSLVVEVPQGLRDGLVDVTLTEAGRTAVQAGFRVQGDLAYGDLLINEFMPDATALDTNGDGVVHEDGDEFVEIVNTTARAVDLTGLELLDGTGEVRHRFPNPTTLPPGGALVVFGGGTPMGFAPPHASGHAQAATSGQLSLNNDGDRIELRTKAGRTLFLVEYDDARDDTSWNRKTDGEPTYDNPALLDDKFKRHSRVDAATGAISPGRRATGAPF